MLAGLWHAPESGKTEGEQRLGTSTIGSSEACMLGGLALKRRWSVARKKAGKSADKPNLVLGVNAQVYQLVSACVSKVHTHHYVVVYLGLWQLVLFLMDLSCKM